jgi:hypothetical protein
MPPSPRISARPWSRTIATTPRRTDRQRQARRSSRHAWQQYPFVAQKAETIGFQVLSLRHSLRRKHSPRLRRASNKPKNGGLFQPDLLTGFAVSEAISLSPWPFLSKAVDCGI